MYDRTWCSVISSLRIQAEGAIPPSEAIPTMYPARRQPETVRLKVHLPAPGGWGARLAGMVNQCELLINVVKPNVPKVLGTTPKGMRWLFLFLGRDTRTISLTADRQNLTRSVTYVERGKPVTLPQGKARRKASRWDCGYGRTEKANACS